MSLFRTQAPAGGSCWSGAGQRTPSSAPTLGETATQFSFASSSPEPVGWSFARFSWVEFAAQASWVQFAAQSSWVELAAQFRWVECQHATVTVANWGVELPALLLRTWFSSRVIEIELHSISSSVSHLLPPYHHAG